MPQDEQIPLSNDFEIIEVDSAAPIGALTPLVINRPQIPETSEGFYRRMCLSLESLTPRQVVAAIISTCAASCSGANCFLSLDNSAEKIVKFYSDNTQPYQHNVKYSVIDYAVLGIFYSFVLALSFSLIYQRISKNTRKVDELIYKFCSICSSNCCGCQDARQTDQDAVDEDIATTGIARYVLYSKLPRTILDYLYYWTIKFSMTGIAEFLLGTIVSATTLDGFLRGLLGLAIEGFFKYLLWAASIGLGLAAVMTFTAVVGHENDSYNKRLVLVQHINQKYEPSKACLLRMATALTAILIAGGAVAGGAVGDYSALDAAGETIFGEIGSTLYFQGGAGLLVIAISATKFPAYQDKLAALFFLFMGGQFWHQPPDKEPEPKVGLDKFTLWGAMLANMAKSALGMYYEVTVLTGQPILGLLAGIISGMICIIMTLALLKDLPNVSPKIMIDSQQNAGQQPTRLPRACWLSFFGENAEDKKTITVDPANDLEVQAPLLRDAEHSLN